MFCDFNVTIQQFTMRPRQRFLRDKRVQFGAKLAKHEIETINKAAERLGVSRNEFIAISAINLARQYNAQREAD